MPWVGHPVEAFRVGPVAPQADLEEPFTAHGTRLDQPAHRRPVTVERPELGVGGVRMCVEVDQCQAPPADVVSNARGVGESDRVVAPQHHRYRPGLSHCRYGLLQALQRFLHFTREHLDVAGVDHR